MTQTQIENLCEEEYSHLLAFGNPMNQNTQSYFKDEYGIEWISTLDSTTYPGMTFGYQVAPCMYTVV